MAQKPRAGRGPAPTKSPLDGVLKQMATVLKRHDARVRQLFHLTNFVSLVQYDPAEAAKDRSAGFERFRDTYDLWERKAMSGESRQARRRVQQLHQRFDTWQERVEDSSEVSAVPSEPSVKEKSAKSTAAKVVTKSAPKKAAAPATTRSATKSKRALKRDHAEASGWLDLELSRDLEVVDESINDQEPPHKRFRVRGLRAKAEIQITHPKHMTFPEHGGSLHRLLDSYHLLDEDEQLDENMYSAKIATQTQALRRVNEARESGLLDELLGMGVGAGEQALTKFVDPLHTHTYLDNFVAQVTYLAKLRANLRRTHLTTAKRNAQMVEQYFRRLDGAEEKERKEQERLLRQLARRIGAEVMKKWKLAHKVVEQRRQAILAEEHREKGKEYLNQILEKSSKLIESRVSGLSDSEYSENESDENASELSESKIKPAGSSESEDSDANLSVTELREKYKSLTNVHLPSSDSEVESATGDNAEDRDGDESNGNGKLTGRRISTVSVSQNDGNEKEEIKFGANDILTNGHSNGNAAVDVPENKIMELGNPSEEAQRMYAETSELWSDASRASSGSDSESESGSMSESDMDMDMESDAGLVEGDANANRKQTLGSLFANIADSEESDIDFDAASNSETSTPEESEAEREERETVETAVDAIPAAASLDVSDIEDAGVEEIETPDDSKLKAEEEPEEVEQIDEPEAHYSIDPPFLLRGELRKYQRSGLDWLAGLVNTQTNGILADEMGLGKTIQTISLLAWMACERHIWGPHLIVVPTSVMLNWEMEFKRFAPGFKVLTYYGNPQQRKRKRRGWNKEDTWHVCITSYQLVIQDQVAFRGKRWQYMILDEAHNIKNFRSQRWQALLNFNARHRLLLTGTPLQNNLIELWSLLYFLMPSTRASRMMPEGFASLEDFQEWFARPVDQMVEEGNEADDEARATIAKLHKVLRPYLLRRLKIDVEKQMPGKYEHIVYCKLSKRQRYLYDDFMSRAATKETLESGNYMSILNCLMQLRKVCNHPDLFEVRPIVTSLAIDTSAGGRYVSTARRFSIKLAEPIAELFDIVSAELEPKWAAEERIALSANKELEVALEEDQQELAPCSPDSTSVDGWARFALYLRRLRRLEQRARMLRLNRLRTERSCLYGRDLRELVRVPPLSSDVSGLVLSLGEREEQMRPLVTKYTCVTPAVVCLDQPELTARPLLDEVPATVRKDATFHESQIRQSIAFPDKRLLQYDCGKLQKMATLMQDLISGGHRALVFTQMTRVLDVLEQFLNIHGWRYLRLDGATRVEQRQALTERFNSDPSIPVFILSTRSGGLGINLTGADTVIFYDSDWNPAMDKQCQDRCHRIGQTRDVHVYRLVSEYTIESNILRKATQKTILDNVVIQEGDFTTEYLNRMSVHDILGNNAGRDLPPESAVMTGPGGGDFEAALAQAEDDDDRAAAKIALSEARAEAQMEAEEFERASAEPGAAGGSAEAEPQEVGHIDDFMIRAIERGDIL